MSQQSRRLTLASSSPRRKELLGLLGYTFDTVSPDIVEEKQSNETAEQYVQRLAKEKAQAGFELTDNSGVVLGSDTIVVIDGDVLEKPDDLEHSVAMLSRMSDRRHQVLTAVTVMDKTRNESKLIETSVWFKPLSEQEIKSYWETGEPCGKAGSYGIQGIGGKFVSRIEGSYHAVMGLPLMETDQLLHKFF
ncbi:Maf family protein [Vibrio nigripulchritudo]|uniref:Maf family protein n=1 Tax=Vibrio nigripulchritudo TaxID=28173 RepID=UPI0024935466|nr:Maf family protein [Vibrio nigripulchritudo]BDU35993.1 Maf-like protein [Vibrio nigripulchritudo]BDU41665.1 Maf-like protein [Vibrio nigripulchritudo]